MKPGPKTLALLQNCNGERIRKLVEQIGELLIDQYEGEVIVALAGVLGGCIKECASTQRSEAMRGVVEEILDAIGPQSADGRMLMNAACKAEKEAGK